jgi:hypothetical protein
LAEFVGSPAASVQYAAQNSPLRPLGGETQGEARMARFSYTHAAGAGTGEINLVKLPPGRLCIYSDLSHIVTSAMGANADLHLGYRAHKTEGGEPVAQNEDALVNGIDADAGVDMTLEFPTDGTLELESQEGVTIYAMIEGGNIENGDTITGWIMYSRI